MSTGSAARVIASCLGLGRLRPAPGTIGSAFGLVLFWLLLRGQPIAVQLVALALVSGIGVVTATVTARQLVDADPSEVVIDEVAGMWLALLGAITVAQFAVAFFAFRAFDIVKPFPARQLESAPAGWGIVLDDLAAGAYALLLVYVLGRLGWLP